MASKYVYIRLGRNDSKPILVLFLDVNAFCSGNGDWFDEFDVAETFQQNSNGSNNDGTGQDPEV